MNSAEWLDTDGDGIGNNADDDDDDDGYTDQYETDCGTDSLKADEVPSDFDGDDLCDALTKPTTPLERENQRLSLAGPTQSQDSQLC